MLSYIRIFLFFCSILILSGLYAADPTGGSIQYSYVGPGTAAGTHQYRVEAHIFQDCQRLSTRTTTLTLNASCSSGGSNNFTLNYIPFVAPLPYPRGGPYAAITLYNRLDGEEVSDLCDSVLDPLKGVNSSCRNGTVPGYIKFIYAGTITLSACNFWTLGLNAGCCRWPTLNTGRGRIYLETQVNTTGFATNSSPIFSKKVKPFPSACINQSTSYGVGAVDPDGDSLIYSLTCSQTGQNNCFSYNSGYSYNKPIPSFKMDSTTGYMTFKPKVTGKAVVSYWVKEYERCTGKWIGQTLRDITFVVNTCNNSVPKERSGIVNLLGKNAIRLDSHRVQVCNGEWFSFDDTIEDPNATDTLLFKTNLQDALPGATFSVNAFAKNKAAVTISWVANLANNPLRSFFIEYSDDACNFPGHGFNQFEVEIVNSTSAGPDIIVCAGVDTAFITGSGGQKYNWRSISGDSLIWSGPNRNIWADTTATDTNKNLKFLPETTTYLEVWSDLKAGCRTAKACKQLDTVKIVAASDYKLSVSNDTVICFHDSTINLSANSDSSQFSYSYKWSPSLKLDYDSVRSPRVTPIISTRYYVTTTSDSGCVKNDSVFVKVSTPMPDSLQISATAPVVCPGQPSKLKVELGVAPSTCGITKKKCAGTYWYTSSNSTATSNSSGNSTALDWPCAYGSAKSARQQYLILASELSAMGITAGTIEQIGFNITKLSGLKQLNGYTIKLRCVPKNITALNSWFLNGFTTVFNAKAVSLKQGWNVHLFDNNYDYDGNSNLVVDICWNNASAAGTLGNNEVAYNTTTFNSSLAMYSNVSFMCGSQSFGTFSRTNRPTFRLSFCGVRDSSEFTYKWTPSSPLNYDTIYKPTATINQNTTFKVVLTDTFKACSDSLTFQLKMGELTISNDTHICVGDPVQLAASVNTVCASKGSFVWSPGKYLNDSTISNPIAKTTKTTQFKVTYTNPCGCVLTDSVTIFGDSLNPDIGGVAPSCQSNLGEIHIKMNQPNNRFSYSVDSGKTYQMDSVFKNVSSGIYNILVRDTLGCMSNLIIDTVLNNSTPIIDSITVKHLSCFNSSDGQIHLFVSRFLPGSTLSIDSGKTWSTNLTHLGLINGNYTVFAKGPTGCISLPKNVVVNAPDSIKITLNVNTDSCFQLGHGWAIGSGSGGNGNLKLAWSGAHPSASHNPLVLQDSIYTKLFKYNQYKLTITDANNCSTDTTFAIDEISQIQVDSLASDSTSCFGYDDGKIFIKVSGGNKPQNAITYLFSADSGKRFVGPTYAATPNQATLSKSINGFSLPKGVHQVQIKDSKGCKIDTTIEVKQPNIMELWTNQDSVRVCVSTCAKLEVFSKGGNNFKHQYHWTPTISNTNIANVCPTKNEVYTVYATDVKGCASNHLLMKVDRFDSLRVKTNSDTAICFGDFAQLNATASGGDNSGYNYSWLPFKDLTSAFVSNPQASPPSNQKYVVKLTDNCGSYPAWDSINIKVLDLPKAIFTADSTTGCPPVVLNFNNQSVNVNSCVWTIGNTEAIETCGKLSKTFTKSGSYDVGLKVKNTDGCSHSIIKKNYVTIFNNPVADFIFSPDPASILEPEVEFTDLSDGRIVKWHWNFAGIDTSLQRNPKFRFSDTKAGKYLIRLDVTNDKSCSANIIKEVEVNAGFYMYVPSAFTPNGDGLNDTWRPTITGHDYDFYEVKVFNRWGELIFFSTNTKEGWDGTYEGELVPIGVYTYKIIIGDSADEKNRHEKHGNVTVIE